MAALIYTTITSLDGFVENAKGEFGFLAPDDEVTEFVTELERPVGTHLYGRRMYETMRVWETMGTEPEAAPPEREWSELWRALEKVVYSRTLPAVTTARTRIERAFEAEAIRDLKREATADLNVAGATLAAEAIRLGLVDEVRLLVQPVTVGEGKRALPSSFGLKMTLLDTRRFGGGTVYLRYRTDSAA